MDPTCIRRQRTEFVVRPGDLAPGIYAPPFKCTHTRSNYYITFLTDWLFGQRVPSDERRGHWG